MGSFGRQRRGPRSELASAHTGKGGEPMARTMAPVAIDEQAVEALASGFRGELVRPPDSSYEEHRQVWNGSIDRRPALIARCAGVADVLAAVACGRRTGLPVAVRSGGHSFPGLSVCDEGLV